jgi:hypothetical protein
MCVFGAAKSGTLLKNRGIVDEDVAIDSRLVSYDHHRLALHAPPLHVA